VKSSIDAPFERAAFRCLALDATGQPISMDVCRLETIGAAADCGTLLQPSRPALLLAGRRSRRRRAEIVASGVVGMSSAPSKTFALHPGCKDPQECKAITTIDRGSFLRRPSV
jgi:hypothetical protein